MKQIRFKRVSRWTPQHWNPHDNLVVNINDQDHELESGHGTHDSISVFTDGDLIYVLVINSGLPYVGLAEYDIRLGADVQRNTDPEGPETYHALTECSQIFLQQDQEMEGILGGDWISFQPIELATKLREYLA